MSSVPDRELALEIKQHEVNGDLHWFELDRRDFLKLFGGGLLICACEARTVAQESGRRSGGHELPKDIAAWLRIAGDGQVTVFTGKVEVGQNIRTSLAQQVAEELRVPIESISLTMGDTDLVPWDAGTFGSRTTPTMGPQLRTMAVAAREMLLNLAAQDWHVEPSALVASDGRIANPKTSQSRSYGELTHGQKLGKVIESEAGVEIYEYQPTMLHQKTMVVDGVCVTVGTTNFDNRSFALSEETNICFHYPALVEQL